MKLKNFILGFIFIVILLVIICEVGLRLRQGKPPFEPGLPQFDYNYVEIHKSFFKIRRLLNGTVIYETQRPYDKPQHFAVQKDRDVKRIFILGGSVARGLDERVFFKEFFEDLIPNMKFEIVNCGLPAYDIYRTSLIHKEILNYNPDLIIILSGNNEHYTPVRLNLWAYRSNRLLRSLWVYRILQDGFLGNNKKISMHKRISKEVRLVNYRRNLKIMIHRAKKRGVPMLVCTLPANFRDCAPTGIPLWHERKYFLAWQALDHGEFEEAIKRFRQFLITHPEDAFGYYYLAQCYDALEDYSQAQQYYIKALALDVNPGDRCPPQRNEVIRQLCAQEGAALADLEKAFIEIAPHGLVGKELMSDHCHWRKEHDSDFLVYNKIIQSLIEYNKTHSESILAPLDRWRYDQTLAKQDSLKMKLFNPQEKGILLAGGLFGDLLRSFNYYYSHFISERWISFLKSAYYFNPNLFDDVTSLKEQILTFKNTSGPYWHAWPGEFELIFNKAWAFFSCHTGEVFRRLGLYPKAIEYFNESINLNPNLWFSYLYRGIAYYKLGEIEKTQRDFKEADRKSHDHFLIEFYRESLGIQN